MDTGGSFLGMRADGEPRLPCGPGIIGPPPHARQCGSRRGTIPPAGAAAVCFAIGNLRVQIWDFESDISDLRRRSGSCVTPTRSRSPNHRSRQAGAWPTWLQS